VRPFVVVVALLLGLVAMVNGLAVWDRTRHEAKAPREFLCEAYYYIGQGLAIRGQRDRAVGMFQAAVAAGPTSAVEYSGARAELKRLGDAGPKP
jgi:lipoprotein NlpI